MRFLAYLFICLTINAAFALPPGRRVIVDPENCSSLLFPDQPFGSKPSEDRKPISDDLLNQAFDVIGYFNPAENAGPRLLVQNAVTHLLSQTYRSNEEALDALEVLLEAVKQRSKAYYSDWKFTKFPGVDGSFGFSGTAGHSLLISPKGELFKGMIVTNVFKDDPPFIWKGSYSALKKLGTLKIVPAQDSTAVP